MLPQDVKLSLKLLSGLLCIDWAFWAPEVHVGGKISISRLSARFNAVSNLISPPNLGSIQGTRYLNWKLREQHWKRIKFNEAEGNLISRHFTFQFLLCSRTIKGRRMFDNENQFENTELQFFDVDFRWYFYSHFRKKHKNMKEGNEKPHGFQDEKVSKKTSIRTLLALLAKTG